MEEVIRLSNCEHGETETHEEDFPDEFQCCVCLDLFYKPVVLGCGHIACFWCIFKAMDTLQGSHCPMCRHCYNHFPSICWLLHYILLKLYPLAYKRRELQVTEEEKKMGYISPQGNEFLPESQFKGKEVDVRGPSSSRLDAIERESKSMGKLEHPINNLVETSGGDGDSATEIPTDSSCNAPGGAVIPEDDTSAYRYTIEVSKRVRKNDLLCGVCEQLLCRPVVLNCGHVYCEACIINPADEVCKCPRCQSLHPNGFPNVCLVLEHFLEEHFPNEYLARKESLLKQVSNPSADPKEKQEKISRIKSVPANFYTSWLSGGGPKVHPAVGCDYCGMCPIVGERYRCKDCKEKIGFDLCEGCYNSPYKLPGRFNQQHKEDHKFEIVEPHTLRELILSLEAENVEETDLHDLDFEELFPASSLSSNVPRDLDDSAESSVSPDSEEQGATDPAA